MKKSVANKVVERLRRFTEALENGEPISELFTCRKIILKLDPQPYDPKMVKKTRQMLGLSQALFAQFIGVSVGTVQSWERGDNSPNTQACRLMDLIRSDPKYWLKHLAEIAVEKVKV